MRGSARLLDYKTFSLFTGAVTHGCHGEELWQQRSWLGASDSTWLYSFISLSASISPSRLSLASFHFLLSFPSFLESFNNSPFVLPFLCWNCRWWQISLCLFFHCLSSSFSFLYSLYFFSTHLHFPVCFFSLLLFSQWPPSACISMVASCVPDVAHSPSCLHHDHEQDRKEMEMIPHEGQGIIILVTQTRMCKCVKISQRIAHIKPTSRASNHAGMSEKYPATRD